MKIPSLGGAEGVSLPGWVFLVRIQPTPAPLPRGEYAFSSLVVPPCDMDDSNENPPLKGERPVRPRGMS
jgi:hypothetical protein